MSITDVVVDIETLGTQPGCPIIQIGYCGFDACDASFTPLISAAYRIPLSAIQGKDKINGDTLDWWFNQSANAVAELISGAGALSATKPSEVSMLTAFAQDIAQHVQRANLWGNSHSFDLVLIEAALARHGMEKHWNFRNERCYRTLKEELYWVKADPFIGTKHTALHDSYNEAAHLHKLLQELRKLQPL
jgi:hypothetical protein